MSCWIDLLNNLKNIQKGQSFSADSLGGLKKADCYLKYLARAGYVVYMKGGLYKKLKSIPNITSTQCVRLHYNLDRSEKSSEKPLLQQKRDRFMKACRILLEQGKIGRGFSKLGSKDLALRFGVSTGKVNVWLRELKG